MLDASYGGALFSKSYQEGYNLIESITAKTYQWPVTRTSTTIVPRKQVGVHDVTKTTNLVDQVDTIHQMINNMMMPSNLLASEPVKVMTDAAEVACIYCGGSPYVWRILSKPNYY